MENMKKIILMIMIIMGLASCESNNAQTQPDNITNNNEAASKVYFTK